MIGPKDKHMIQAGPKYFPRIRIYWRREKEVFLSLSLLNGDKVNLELPVPRDTIRGSNEVNSRKKQRLKVDVEKESTGGTKSPISFLKV